MESLRQRFISIVREGRKGVLNMDDVYRLAKPRKKGLLHLVFSRFFLVLVLVVLQIILAIVFYGWLENLLPFFSFVLVLITLGGGIYLFNSGMDSPAKLTWMFVIAILPVSGVAFLIFTRVNLGHRKIQDRVGELISMTKDAVSQPEGVMEKLAATRSGTDDLVTYLNNSGCFPAFDQTEVKYFPLGEDKFAALLAEQKKTNYCIVMETFIKNERSMWAEILKTRQEKAKTGVKVRGL